MQTLRVFREFGMQLAWLSATAGAASAATADVRLSPQSVVHFADVREGIEAITQRDDYIERLSPFDRQVRLQTDRDVSRQELLDFIASHVLPWQPADVELLAPLLEEVARRIEAWKLNLPPVVLLVKTSGREEGGAAYCRGPTIVLPKNMLDGPRKKLASIVRHELFHVLSSHNPQLRETLYESIGFRECNEIVLPEALARRKITNPDAPVIRHYITVSLHGQPAELVPVLLSKSERYDARRGGTLFSYLDFKLLRLRNDAGVRTPDVIDGQAVLLDPKSVPGYAEQVGRNTAYTIHPEEVLADNFVFLLEGRIDLPSQAVVERMGHILQQHAVGR